MYRRPQGRRQVLEHLLYLKRLYYDKFNLFKYIDYFELVKTCVSQKSEAPLSTPKALIPLKARAFLDLTGRKLNGDQVNQRDIKKHRNDVFRLAAVLGDIKFELVPSIKKI